VRGTNDRGVADALEKGGTPAEERNKNEIEATEQETDQPQVTISHDSAQASYRQVLARFRLLLFGRSPGTRFDKEIEEQADNNRVPPPELPHLPPAPMESKKGSKDKHRCGSKGYPYGPDTHRFASLIRGKPQGHDFRGGHRHEAQSRPLDKTADEQAANAFADSSDTRTNGNEEEGSQSSFPGPEPLKDKSGRYRQEETGDSKYGHEKARLAGALTEGRHQQRHDRRNLELIQGGRHAREEDDGQNKPG